MKIRVINTPPGEAPEDVRAAWVGLELPLAVPGECARPTIGVVSHRKPLFDKLVLLFTGKTKRHWGYLVDAARAVEILAARSPEAANWWREKAAQSIQPGKRFLFAAEACQEIAGDSDEATTPPAGPVDFSWKAIAASGAGAKNVSAPEGFGFLGTFEPFQAEHLLNKFTKADVRFETKNIERRVFTSGGIVSGAGYVTQNAIQIFVYRDDQEEAAKIYTADWKV